MSTYLVARHLYTDMAIFKFLMHYNNFTENVLFIFFSSEAWDNMHEIITAKFSKLSCSKEVIKLRKASD